MGSGRNYNPDGGFYAKEWDYKGESINNIKIIYNSKDEKTNGLPLYSNTSDAYFKKMHGEVVQIRLYKKRLASVDIDIMQAKPHTNKDGTVFSERIVHVHEWKQTPKGWKRSEQARFLTEEEIKRWGGLILKANPNVRLRP